MILFILVAVILVCWWVVVGVSRAGLAVILVTVMLVAVILATVILVTVILVWYL